MIEFIEDTRMIIRHSSFCPTDYSNRQNYEIINDLSFYLIINNIFEGLFDENIRKLHFHELMQKEVYNLAKTFNLMSHMEYKVSKEKLDNKRHDLIDVVWFNDDQLVSAIEIDSSPRKKSINKLLAVKPLFRFWIYYGKSLSRALYLLDRRDPEKLITMIMFEGMSFKRSENSL